MIRTPEPAELRRRSGRKWRHFPEDVLPAWIADMDFEPAPVIAAAIDDGLRLGDFGYGPPAARSGVPEAFAAWAQRRWNWACDPDDVLLMPDVVGGIANCIEALTEAGDAVLVQTPAYPPLLSAVKAAGRTLVDHALVDGRTDFDLLEREIAARKVRLLLFCHPHNPTGHVFTLAKLRRLADIAERHDLIVVSDEVHADLTFAPACHMPLAPLLPERIVTLNAASKAFNIAGLRTAVCVAPPALRRRLAALPSTRWNAFSTLGLRATLAAWSDEGEIWLQACLTHLAGQRAHLASRLLDQMPGIAFKPPEASYLAWLDCRALGIGDPAAFFLERARVALSPGPDFGAPGAGFARLNFATSREILDEILDRMVAAL